MRRCAVRKRALWISASWATATYPDMTMLFGGDFDMSPGTAAYAAMTTTTPPQTTDSWEQAVLAKTATAYTTVSFTTPTRSSDSMIGDFTL